MASTEFATSSRSTGARLLLLLGFVLLATGVGFALAPHYSWHVTKVARLAAELGIHSGALAVGGLVLLGLGIVARAAGMPVPQADTSAHHEALQSELQLLSEQMSTKLAQLRASLQQVTDSVNAVAAQQQELAHKDHEQGGGSDLSQDAVFRLAASLDKLHAHLDERVHAVDLQLRSGFESLLNASHEVRRSLEQRTRSAPAAGLDPHGQLGLSEGEEHSIDFYQTMQKLDAISGAEEESPARPRPGHARTPQAPFPSPGQGPIQGEDLDALLPEEYRDRY